MDDLAIIDKSIVIKEVFGSFSILDQFDVCDIPQVIKFATIVYNYSMMQKKLDELK
jgi:hypothetical protein